MTLNEVVEEIKTIKSVINRIEIKGEENANYVLFSCQKCDALIHEVNKVIESHQNESIEAGE